MLTYVCSQYELDRREQELKYREERMREWSMNLQEKDSEYRKRYELVVILMFVACCKWLSLHV